MRKKRRLFSPAPVRNRARSFGTAPITDEMCTIINSMKNCTAQGDEAIKMLDQAVRQLLHASLDQLAKHREKSLHNNDTQHT